MHVSSAHRASPTVSASHNWVYRSLRRGLYAAGLVTSLWILVSMLGLLVAPQHAAAWSLSLGSGFSVALGIVLFLAVSFGANASAVLFYGAPSSAGRASRRAGTRVIRGTSLALWTWLGGSILAVVALPDSASAGAIDSLAWAVLVNVAWLPVFAFALKHHLAHWMHAAPQGASEDALPASDDTRLASAVTSGDGVAVDLSAASPALSFDDVPPAPVDASPFRANPWHRVDASSAQSFARIPGPTLSHPA